MNYQLTPLAGFKQNGKKCREFVTKTTYKNKSSEQYGKAYREEDGEWRVLNER